jgi:hypothetical protein
VSVQPVLPTGLAGIPVHMSNTPQGPSGVPVETDASGHFEFRASGEPQRSNNWGVAVDPNYSPL